MIRVMVLDHKLMDVIKLKKALAGMDFEVQPLTSPNGVLAKLDYERPDILVVNPWMPRLDIDNLIGTIIHTPVFETMVLVAWSDRTAEELQAFCLERDMHGYYSKSNPVDQLGAFLMQFFE